MRIVALLPLLAIGLGSAFVTGCNLFGRLDNPSADPDKYDAALQLANSGDCGDATNLLNSIVLPTDDVNSALGWSEMCQGGVTASMLATSIYQYSTAATNYTALGQLARSMLPINASGLAELQLAVSQFSGIRDPLRKNTRVAIADFAIAGWILAKQAPAGHTLTQSNISSNAACSSDSASCSTSLNCVSGMSASDVQAFLGAITAAGTALQQSGATSLAALASGVTQACNATPAGGATSTSVCLCVIYNYLIPTP